MMVFLEELIQSLQDMPDIKDLNVARNKWPLFIIGLPGRNSIRFVKLMVMILEFSGRASL